MEFYLDDPALKSALSLCRDAGGVWCIYRADGREYVYDSLEECMEDYGEMLRKYYMEEACA